MCLESWSEDVDVGLDARIGGQVRSVGAMSLGIFAGARRVSNGCA